jgi:hypothetical protein
LTIAAPNISRLAQQPNAQQTPNAPPTNLKAKKNKKNKKKIEKNQKKTRFFSRTGWLRGVLRQNGDSGRREQIRSQCSHSLWLQSTNDRLDDVTIATSRVAMRTHFRQE